MNIFKLRAEAITDCVEAIELLLCGAAFKMESTSLGCVYLTFGANLNLYEVREWLKEVENGHVMVQTANHKDKFDGGRYFFGYQCYIDYLNKDNNFRETRIEFANEAEAVEWAKENLKKYDRDMIKYHL